jgi:hypothetical protein
MANEMYTALTFQTTGYKDSGGAREFTFNFERDKKVVQICATPDLSRDQNVITEMTVEDFWHWTKDLQNWAFLVRSM